MRLNEDGTISGTTTCLWEAMVLCSVEERRKGEAMAYEALLHQLGDCACMSFQELGITPHKLGWLITINACHENGRVEILIPKDRLAPIQVLEDTRATSADFERYNNE